VFFSSKPEAPLRLALAVREAGDVTVVELDGRLTLGSEADFLREKVTKLIGTGHTRILLQLAGLDRLDSIGVGTLLDLKIAARRRGGDVRLCQLSKSAEAVLSLLGLLRRPDLLGVFPSEQAALAGFTPTVAAA
jgi:anti-anti-sigma factor